MKFIQERPDWSYVNVYADEGITRTNTRRRVEFNKMISELLNKLIKENSKSGATQDEYNKKYGELMNRYERTKEKHEELIRSRSAKKSQAIILNSFLSNLKKVDDRLSEWNEHVWMLLVDSAVVHRDKSITFKFHNNNEVKTKYV